MVRSGPRLCGKFLSWCGRLAKDRRGSTLYIVTFALIPLLAALGAGLDLTRAYMAQTKLQQAVDFAAIAGRRAMINDDINTATGDATKFFNFNFPTGMYGIAQVTPVITKPATGTVMVTASAGVPTSLLTLFGYRSLPIQALSQVTQNFVNTDVELVLDTTGSMACDTSGNNCNSGSSSKIVALRKAVLALYDQLKPAQDQLATQGLRLRFGIVPYSSTVNVGKLVYAQNTSYMRNPAPYYKCTKYDKNDNCSAFASSPTNVSHSASWFSSTWEGCIEERKTTSSITALSGYTIPAAAYDLNIDLLPTSDTDTKWVPYDPDAQTANLQTACPAGAKLPQSWARTDLDSFLGTLSPTGGTYHDIGMIWGTRSLSSNGVFASSNPASYGTRPVNKVIIFMTDGLLDTGPYLYGAYGVEAADHRVVGNPYTNSNDQDARHRQRFKMICNAAKGMNISIWVISFASALDADLIECASNASQASTAADQAALITKFIDIGRKIGPLRIEQ